MKVVRMNINDIYDLISSLIDNVKDCVEDKDIDSARDYLDQIDYLQKMEWGLYFSEKSPYKYDDILNEVMEMAEGELRIIREEKDSEEWQLL